MSATGWARVLQRCSHFVRGMPVLKALSRRILPTIGALLVVFLWLAVGSAFITMPPPLAVVWIALTIAAFLWVHGYRPAARATALHVVRLRPLTTGRRWILLAIVPMLLFHAFFLIIYLRITGVPDPTPHPFEGYLQRPSGWIPLAFFLAVAVPIIEEFGLRGWIQRPLERLIGAPWAVVLTAALFAAAHLQLLGLPTRFFAGVFFGYAVWATRSIWAPVILHGAHNLSLILPAAFAPEPTAPPPTPGVPVLLLAALGLAASTLILGRIALRLYEERRAIETRREDGAVLLAGSPSSDG